jgi:HAD superfamily hydrolase (TIGR01509 family)
MTTPPLPPRAVVFDLDGLMFDTERLFVRVASEMLQSRGKVFTTEIMNAMIGRRAVDAGESFRQMSGLEEPVEVLMAEVRSRFNAEMETAVHPTPGLFALLARLEQRGLPRAVATSSRRAYAATLLQRHRLAGRFAFVLSGEDVTRGKPDPEIYLTAAARFGVPPGRMLVLEDSAPGVAAAKAAGALVVAVPHEHSPAERLTAADRIVATLDDPVILALIGDEPEIIGNEGDAADGRP